MKPEHKQEIFKKSFGAHKDKLYKKSKLHKIITGLVPLLFFNFSQPVQEYTGTLQMSRYSKKEIAVSISDSKFQNGSIERFSEELHQGSGLISIFHSLYDVNTNFDENKFKDYHGFNGYGDLILESVKEKRLDPLFVAALIKQESDFNTDRISNKDAVGLMQIKPATARDYIKGSLNESQIIQRLRNPEINLQIGTSYLESLLDKYDNEEWALAAYNAGPKNVERWKDGLMDDDTDWDKITKHPQINIPKETKKHVKNIMAYYEDYKRKFGTLGY